MVTKIFGILASAAIVVVIALSLLNFGNYRSLLPERTKPTATVEEVVEIEVAEIDSTAVIDSTTIAMADSLAIAEPADTLQLEQ